MHTVLGQIITVEWNFPTRIVGNASSSVTMCLAMAWHWYCPGCPLVIRSLVLPPGRNRNRNWSTDDEFLQQHLSSPSLHLSQVIATSSTSQETFDSLLNFSKELGKTPVSCKVRTALHSGLYAWRQRAVHPATLTVSSSSGHAGIHCQPPAGAVPRRGGASAREG